MHRPQPRPREMREAGRTNAFLGRQTEGRVLHVYQIRSGPSTHAKAWQDDILPRRRPAHCDLPSTTRTPTRNQTSPPSRETCPARPRYVCPALPGPVCAARERQHPTGRRGAGARGGDGGTYLTVQHGRRAEPLELAPRALHHRGLPLDERGRGRVCAPPEGQPDEQRGAERADRAEDAADGLAGAARVLVVRDLVGGCRRGGGS